MRRDVIAPVPGPGARALRDEGAEQGLFEPLEAAGRRNVDLTGAKGARACQRILDAGV